MRATERGLLLVGTLVLFVVGASLIAMQLADPADSGLEILLLWPPGFGVAGAIVTKHHRQHAVGRLLLWAGFSSAFVIVFSEVGTLLGSSPEEVEGLVGLVVLLFSGLWSAPILCLFAAIARFPDGEWASLWVKRLFWVFFWAFGVWGFVEAVGSPLLPQPEAGYGPWAVAALFTKPAIVHGMADRLTALLSFVSAVATTVMTVLVVVVSLRSDPVRRRQISVVILGFVLTIVLLALPFDGAEWMGTVLLLVFPASLVVAITRYKLYEIDRIVSRSVSYLVTIGLLGGLYAVVVIGSRSVLGVEGPLPVALWTLAAAFALFPLARRIQGWVDRRFFRSRYDSASVVGAFADEMRTTVDRDSLVERTESVVGETFQAVSVGVWLAEEPA